MAAAVAAAAQRQKTLVLMVDPDIGNLIAIQGYVRFTILIVLCISLPKGAKHSSFLSFMVNRGRHGIGQIVFWLYFFCIMDLQYLIIQKWQLNSMGHDTKQVLKLLAQ